MAGRQFGEWCEAMVEQVVELDDELIDQPPGPANQEEVRVLVASLVRLV